MKDKTNERQLSIIFLFIAGAFALILLSFAYLSTSLTLRYQESETKMLSVELFYLMDEEAKNTTGENRGEILSEYFTVHAADYADEGISMWLTDAEGNVLAEGVDNASEFKASYLEGLKDGKSVFKIQNGKTPLFLADMEICIIRSFSDGEYRLVVANDGSKERQIQRMQYVVFFSIGVILAIILIVLISNIISRYKVKIIRLATMDELTGLANRKSFTAEYKRRVLRAYDERTDKSLFLLDIDYFKQINDQNGHSVGDAALVLLADHIKKFVEETGGIAGRWGGDEFIGLINLSVEDARTGLFELCKTIREDSQKDEPAFTISVGLTPVDGEKTLAEVCEYADVALYDSKKKGRNTVTVFTESLLSVVEESGSRREKILKEFKTTEGMSLNSEKSEKTDLRNQDRDLIRMLRERFLISIVFAVKWMTPFVAAGGILIATAFLFDAASIDLSTLSVDERSELGSITSVATYLKFLGDTTFNFMLPVFSAFMAYSLAGESAFMAGFVGGYMVIDSNSGFIGATIAGLAAGIISREISLFTERLPRFIRGAAPIVIYPVFNLTIVQAISFFLITPAASALGSLFNMILNSARGQSPALVCTLAAGMMSVDMGGIINKIAYNYGLASIAAKDTVIMAAVMAGGMVPPIGIAISGFIFKDRFSKEEKNNGVFSLFMGLSFITEGALPYVIIDVTRVIPSCIAGSALAGLLSSVFGCTLPAPHGGIFVLPVVGHPLLYCAAIGTGAMFTALILGMLKKRRKILPDLNQQAL